MVAHHDQCAGRRAAMGQAEMDVLQIGRQDNPCLRENKDRLMLDHAAVENAGISVRVWMAWRDSNESPGLPREGRSLSCKHRHDSNPDVSCPPEVERKAGPWLDLIDPSRLKRREEQHDHHP